MGKARTQILGRKYELKKDSFQHTNCNYLSMHGRKDPLANSGDDFQNRLNLPILNCTLQEKKQQPKAYNYKRAVGHKKSQV